MKKAALVLAALATVAALPALAEETINIKPTGARLAVGEEGTDVVVSYRIETSDVNMGINFSVLLELPEIRITPLVRGANRDVIGFDAEKLQAFLHVYSYRGSTPPDADNEVRAKAALVNLHRQTVGILE